MAKNVRVIPPEATAKRRSLNSLRSSIGCCAFDSHAMNSPIATAAPPNQSSALRAQPSVAGALDDGVDERAQPDDRQQRTDGVERSRLPVLRLRHEHGPGAKCEHDDGQVDEEDRPPPVVLEQQPGGERADRRAGPRDARPDGDRLGPLAGREDVGEDRQGRRHDERRADAHDRPGRDHLAGGVGERAEQRAEPEHDEAELEGALAAEPVTEGAGGEEEAGEDRARRRRRSTAVRCSTRRVARDATSSGARR